MINEKTQLRELCYVVKIDDIKPIIGSDNCEAAIVRGWQIMVHKNTYHKGDLAVYFEIDSLVDISKPEFAFLASKKGKIKTQRYTFGGKNPGFYSQGLLLSAAELNGEVIENQALCLNGKIYKEGDFLTEALEVKYYEEETQEEKTSFVDKYKRMAAKHPEIFKNPIIKKIYKTTIGKKILFFFLGKKKKKDKDKDTAFPTKFPYVKKTDQERCENLPRVLKDKTPFIVTQKCDGSSGTFILERKKDTTETKYEFYVCSRNKRQLTPNQKSHYWNVALKYNLKEKMQNYMDKHPELNYLCWQGEVCAPQIQKNPHGLTEEHLFLFCWIDSIKGKWDIREAVAAWKEFDLETVPIVSENFILPDDFEEFKQQAEGFYDPSVCEGKTEQRREGFVYYKTTNPNFSFKNVSRSYLLKHS